MDIKLTKIFLGTDIEANYIAAMLQDEDINCVVRNAFQASITVGWADGNPSQSTELFVNESDVEKARKIVENYMNKK